MSLAPISIGIPAGRADIAGSQATGYHQANSGLFNALLRHGSPGTIHVVKSSLLPRASLDLSPIATPPGSRKTAAVEIFAPVGGADRLSCSVWHDLTGTFKNLYEWRTLGLTGRAPFTFASHGFHFTDQEPLQRLVTFDVQPCDSLICSTPSTRALVEKLLEHTRELAKLTGSTRRLPFRLDVIPHGVDTDRFRPQPKATLRDQLGLPPSALIVLSLGRISPAWKGDLLPLLAVFRSVIRARPGLPLLLLIAGNVRPDEKYYEALLRAYAAELQLSPEQIKFVGPINAQDSQLWYAAADIFVGVTHFDNENFGLTAVEAMAAGTPQIVTSWGGCRDTVVDDVTGFQIPTFSARCDRDLEPYLPLWRAVDGWLIGGQTVGFDTRAFRERLLALIDNGALRSRMAEESRRRAVSLYDWKHVVRQYEDLWRELIQQSSQMQTMPSVAVPKALTVFDRISALSSTELAMDESVEISEIGTSVLEGKLSVPIYLGMESVFSMEAVTRILELLRRRGRTRVGALLAELSPNDADAAHPLRHLLFALKQGFVELCVPATV